MDAGYPNGRLLTDDVTDRAIRLISNQTITGDGVDANDVDFLAEFPYLAPPHQP